MTILHDASSGNGIGQEFPLPAKITESSIMQPVDIQGRYQQTIQTHNAVSVGASGNSSSGWFDCNGFDKIAVTLKNDAATTSSIELHWSHDGTTKQGSNLNDLVAGTKIEKTEITEIMARYVRLYVKNGDGALAHIMSAWVYLKA